LATIQDELSYTNCYLEIQKLRMGDRLIVKKNISPDILMMSIPTYVIQTLTENCFKHSFEKYEGQALLDISIYGNNDKLILEIWNSKGEDGLDKSAVSQYDSKAEGTGLNNLRARLNLLYKPSDTELKIFDFNNGTKVM